MSMILLLIAAAVIAASGLPGLFLGRYSAIGQWIATLMNLGGTGIGAVGLVMSTGHPAGIFADWSLPIGRFSVGIDDLTLIFIIPVLLISALGAIYGMEYWQQSRHPANARRLRLCWGILTAAMMLVLLARDAVPFLIAWEVMGLAAFFLCATEHNKLEARKSAWIYLVAAHAGALCLMAMFGLMRSATGSFDLWPAAMSLLSGKMAAGIFVTGLLGFGLKAGLMPLHVWLPVAHANAPSHVSAILSGAMLNTGIYGIVRVTALIPHPPLWWGATLLIAGSLSGVLGIAFAVAQDDFKRLLAYSSIENIGIITIGIGLAVLGRSFDHFDWIVLGLGGALLHMLNHSLFKPLLFMGAGSILHETRTRRMDLLGGLAKKMPRTFVLFVFGAVAICGLPPFNGFVGELLIYLGLFRTAGIDAGRTCSWAILAAPALAMIGALAVSAFVKLIGVVFEGSPRSRAGEHARDPCLPMLAPMIFLAACCVMIGLLPMAVMPLINAAVTSWDARPAQSGLSIGNLLPLPWLSAAAIALMASVLIGVLILRRWRRHHPPAAAGIWDCGYIRPAATMQYTASSFAQFPVSMFAWAIFPRRLISGLYGVFPRQSRMTAYTPDTVLDSALLPVLSRSQAVLSLARPIQRGSVQIYVLYILTILIALLVFAGWTG